MEPIFQFDFDDAEFDMDTPPPEYAAHSNDPVHAVTRQHQLYLPSFDEVMALYEYEDSMRLPTYQARPIRRYHPYWRVQVRPTPEQLHETRYFNTIYDEEMVELDVPAREAPSNPRVPTPYHSGAARTGPLDRLEIPPIPQGLPPLPPVAAPFPAEGDPLNLEEQRRHRLYQLWYLIPEFVKTVMEALEAASRARTAGAAPVPVPASPEEHLPTPPPTPPPPPPSASSQSASTSDATLAFSPANN
ncbi:hypothetical protein DXG03_006103 [Asterophora parasitica]|uniref:Uncharacterized protein n=1 Tax=Asterophora parasitica TaxID=117018 RepID=A0A9P7KG23_9AGAR|nr:hypothetical protein DXG03_006103 [Asterophora parasitica]